MYIPLAFYHDKHEYYIDPFRFSRSLAYFKFHERLMCFALIKATR